MIAAPPRTLRFDVSPPGLSPLHDFTLEPVDGAPGLFTMRAEPEVGIRLFLIEPDQYLPEYTPEFTEEQVAPVGGPESATLFVVATLDASEPVVNLLAPILVNPDDGRAAQVILDSSDWPLRAKLSDLASA
ncbi:MAG: flagellar assembly protein FliW [Actinomycetota bacterium]|nr:flagellar assembly protein FliW [Actinomycetota bacterium]